MGSVRSVYDIVRRIWNYMEWNSVMTVEKLEGI